MSCDKPNCPMWNGDIRTPPCTKDCPERYPGCHAASEEYAKFRAAKDAETAKRDAIRAGRYSKHERLLVNHKLRDKAKRGELD